MGCFTCQMLPSVTELCTWTFGQELYNELCDHQQPLRFLGGIQFMERFQDKGALCTCHLVQFFNTNTTTMYKKSACKHEKQLGGEAAVIFCSGSTMGNQCSQSPTEATCTAYIWIQAPNGSTGLIWLEANTQIVNNSKFLESFHGCFIGDTIHSVPKAHQ